MRVLMILVALVATPFVASVSQDRSSSSPQRDHQMQCEQQGQNDGEDCSTLPPPPACAVSAVAPVGTWLSGRVFHDGAPGTPGLPGWCIELRVVSGTVIGPVIATALTNASGEYLFADLAGTLSPESYALCEVQQIGWTQSFPTLVFTSFVCPSTLLGYSFPLAAGNGSPDNNFGNR